MDRRTFLAGSAAICSLSTGCLSSGPDDAEPAPAAGSSAWPMRGRTPDRRSFAPDTSPPSDEVQTEWQNTAMPDRRTSMTTAPVTDEQWVYVGSGSGSNGPDGFVTAFDGASGERRWRTEITGGRVRDLAYRDDRIFAVSSEHDAGRGTLTALRSDDGTRDWTVELESPAVRGFLVTDGRAYAVTRQGGLTAVSLDGADRWNTAVVDGAEYLSTSPSAANGSLFVGTDRGRLVAVDAATGRREWQTPVTDDAHRPRLHTMPTVVDGTVFVSATDYHLYAVASADGTVRWQTRLLSKSYGNSIPSAVGVDDVLYVNTTHGGLLAIARADGTERWRAGRYGSTLTPAAAGDLIVVPLSGGAVRAYDSGGARRWHFEMTVPETEGLARYIMQPEVALAHGRVYIALHDGRVYALGSG